MRKLKTGDRIHLAGGYDMDPPWLKGGSGYDATVLRFIDNGIEKRKGDERLSAVIQFDSELDLKGLKGRFGLILGRWEGQKWATEGVVHVHLMSEEIFGQNEMTEENSRWVESHASYKKLTNHWLTRALRQRLRRA